jgi:hypothetical protein
MAAFWAVFTFGGSGLAITPHGSLDLKQEIQIQIQIYKLDSRQVYFIGNVNMILKAYSLMMT